jgi:hypothetical protein
MVSPRLIGVMVLVCASSCTSISADLKAVFAFHEKVVSIRFPEFNYGIVTTVDENIRKIAISYPAPKAGQVVHLSSPHLEITLEPIAGDVSSPEYHAHYLERYIEGTGSTSAPVDDSHSFALALRDSRMTYLLFNDGELRAHKALLITSIDEGVGVVIVLDTLADDYSANENVSNGILESIQFEN